VRIFSRAIDREKKAALEGAWVHHTLPGKASTYRTSQREEKRLDLEKTFFGRDPPKLVFAASSNYN
jgi:hypothetical protein